MGMLTRLWPFQSAKTCVFRPNPGPGNPQNRPEMWAPGPPDIVGLSWEIIGFRNRGGGPAGHPQGVQVNAYSQYKVPPQGPPRILTRLTYGEDPFADEAIVDAGPLRLHIKQIRRPSACGGNRASTVSLSFKLRLRGSGGGQPPSSSVGRPPPHPHPPPKNTQSVCYFQHLVSF